MASPKEVNLEELSDEELDMALEESEIEEMSDEELDSALSEEQESKPLLNKFESSAFDFMFGKGAAQETEEAISSSKQGENLKSLVEKEKLIGQIGQSVILANTAAGILSKVPALSKQKVIQGLVSSAEQKATAAGVRLSNLQRAVQRHAIEGAVAVQAFDYDSVGDRIKSTAIASAISPVIGIGIDRTMSAATNIMRNVRKFKSSIKGGLKETTSGTTRDPRLPSITKVREELSAAESEGKQIGQSSRRQLVDAQKQGSETSGQISERAKSFKSRIESEADAKIFQVKQSVKETTRQINQSIDDTTKLLNQESDIAAKTFQSKITSFYRENSAAYGRELNAVSDEIATTGRMTRGEALDVLKNSIQRSGSEAEVIDGPIITKMRKLIQDKYGEELVDAAGNVVRRDLSEMVSFKEFLEDARSIWKDIKPYKSGARFSQDEIPAAILQSEFGEMVSNLPGGEAFKSLQSAYRPVISYMNKANSVLQPYKGEAYTKTAETLVKRYASGSAAEADKQLIQFLETGTERFAKGMGAVTGRARQLGENIKALKTNMSRMGLQAEKRILEIAEEGAMKISKINMAEEGAGKMVQQETERRTAMIMQEAAEQEMKFWKRAKTLTGRFDLIRSLNEKNSILKRFAVGVTTTVGGLTSLYVVARGAREIATAVTGD